MIPEIWSVTDRFFFLVLDHFLPFYPFPLNNPINCNRQIFLSSWAIVCPFTPLTARKMKIKKWKNTLEISSFYRCVPKIMIIGFIVPEIWHVTDLIIFQFGQFFALLPPKSPKNKNFKKMKKTPGDIIILHKCTKNYDYRLYYSWDTAHDECNCYFSFRAIFCPFTPLTAQKIKISKNEKKKQQKNLEIPSCYACAPKIMIRWCTVPEIWCETDGRTDGWRKVTYRGGCPI